MKILIALTLILSTSVHATEEMTDAAQRVEMPRMVSCDLLHGQLGNQLFQIAAVLAYAWDYDATPIFPDLNRHEANLSYNKERIFFRLDASPPPRSYKNTFHECSWHSALKIPYQDDVFFWGYFQSWKHFHHQREKILDTLAPSENILENLFAKHADLIAKDNTVCINVRTFNPQQSNSKRWPFLGLDYYQKAIDLFPTDTLFVVFSDRINWCKHHFQTFNRKFIFIDGGDAIDDLFLMSMMCHHILANSSLAWWGAYLNTNPDKIVVVPQNWTHPDVEVFPGPQPNDFYFDNWIAISNSFDTPYPDDMKSYDPHSQSDDGDQ